MRLQKNLVETELSLTGQFFAYAAKLYKGTDSNVAQLGWFIPRKKVDLTAILDSAILAKAKETDRFAALNSQYKQLQFFLQQYYSLEKNNAWDSIPLPEKPLHANEQNKIIHLVKNRLFLLHDLNTNDSTNIFDTALLAATKHFQKRMGLNADGIIGKKMIQEINIPLKKRIEQLLINMERLRWMPADRSDNYIFVNIPEYKMYVNDSGKNIFTMNVIVGKSANSTVIFTGNLSYIVFSPYWNVPKKHYRKKKYCPACAKTPIILQKHNMEITGHTPDGLPAIRQKPGNDNSLGHVKFLFPNNYDIYFHDTPQRDLFTATDRSFSHGCIRVGAPKKLAEYLLRYDTTHWNSITIDTAMNQQAEKMGIAGKKVPVIIGYFTAFVTEDGILNFRKDIYGHDARMAEKLFIKK